MDRKLCELELRVLGSIGNMIGQALDLDRIFDLVLGILSKDLSTERGTIALKNGEKDRLAIRASLGVTEDAAAREERRIHSGIEGVLFRFSEPFVIRQADWEPLLLSRTGVGHLNKAGISHIGMPLILQDAPIGVIHVDKLFGENVPLAEDVRFLAILAGLVAQFVHLNKRIEDREQHLVRANTSLRAEISEQCMGFFDVAGSPSMIEATQLIKKVAPTAATVLLIGEPGTGKRLAGRAIHELSERRCSPFLQVSIAGKPDDLLESEIFGYEKGPFAGTLDTRSGRLEEAEGGSLFLDEIGDLSMPLQARLMRLLQDREFERVGSTTTRTADVRIIGSTTRDLHDAVQLGTFRQDLYYRLNVFPINMPALRRRREDLRSLVRHFSEKMMREYGCDLRFSPEALQMLVHYSWPGNAREMENLIERLAIAWEGEVIEPKHLNPFIAQQYEDVISEEAGRARSLVEMERDQIIEALDRNNWIQSRAANDLGITLRQIGYRLKKFGLEKYVKMRRSQLRQSRDESEP